MKVLKFGGTSVGSREGLLNVKKIVEGRQEDEIVVVSAFSGITDRLIRTAALAAARDESYIGELEGIKSLHRSIISELFTDKSAFGQVSSVTELLLNSLEAVLKSICQVGDISANAQCEVVSYGERLSSIVVAHLIDGAVLHDSLRLVMTYRAGGMNIPDMDLTSRLIHNEFDRAMGGVHILQGFISRDRVDGSITNLGRGGSDYTASILASVLDADVLEIWTDVDGFMTADPRIIKTSYVIRELSYREAMELCNFGAKVIYPPTLYPVRAKGIPIRIKNTFNPDAEGSVIKENCTHEKAITGITSIDNICLLTLSANSMVGLIGIDGRIFGTMAAADISIFLICQSSSETGITIGVSQKDAPKAMECLSKEFEREIALGSINPIEMKTSMASVAIVGDNMKNAIGLAGKLFSTLGRNGINITALTQGSEQTNISFVVESRFLRKSLNVIHDNFFLSECKELNLFICGVGTIGSKLLEQIASQRDKLRKEHNLKLNVVGICRSRRGVFDRTGLDINCWKSLLDKGQEVDSRRILDEVIGMNIFNSVFVDCTASKDIALLYKTLFEHGVSVVAANKIAASSAYPEYRLLKDTSLSRNVKFLIETNVGAGLPIIHTINDLVNSGDKVEKIEAVLSGSLNFIFNTLSQEIPFSKAVRMAQEEGYLEPDPRIDLSGTDVMRKLVILSREAGYATELADVKAENFVPDEFFSLPPSEFMTRIATLDVRFENMRRELSAAGMRLRYVASMEEGKYSVGLKKVGADHPFYNLDGSNNIIMLTTERYHLHPMLIKGYGAGADVTAAGVFADIMSIANI